MGRFKIFLIGSSHAPIIEVPADSLGGLGNIAQCSRFLEGEIVDCQDGEGGLRVLIPVSRIQMIAEAQQ